MKTKQMRTERKMRTMNTMLAIVYVASVSGCTQVQAQETRSPLVRQMYNGNWPSDKEAQQLRDELYYSMAIQAYMTMLPALNTIGMRDGSEKALGAGYNILPMWKDRMDAKTWVPTPNADIMYAMSYLDLKETGPLVVAAPPGVIGMFIDFFQRTIVDVGAIGPDRGRGGLYLLLPPNTTPLRRLKNRRVACRWQVRRAEERVGSFSGGHRHGRTARIGNRTGVDSGPLYF